MKKFKSYRRPTSTLMWSSLYYSSLTRRIKPGSWNLSLKCEASRVLLTAGWFGIRLPAAQHPRAGNCSISLPKCLSFGHTFKPQGGYLRAVCHLKLMWYFLVKPSKRDQGSTRFVGLTRGKVIGEVINKGLTKQLF